VHGWNFLTGKADVSAGAASGHGTHVAGVIDALSGNQLGVAGLADGATIVPVPFIGAEGGYDSDAIRAITYATSQGATIINASWGASIAEAPAAANPALADAIRACGCLFVTAAGNNGHDMDEPGYQVYPAAFGLSNELSVAAVDNQGQLAPFSDFGRRAIDLAAPGVGILSTVPGGYGWGDGTSMATPYVTATAALLTAADPSLTPAELANLLRATARPVGSLAGLVRSGGMVSASAGVAVAVSGSTRTLTGLPRVPRIAGQDRYDTAAQVAGQLPPGQPVAYLATGTGFADASAGAVLAARDGAPLLLTEPNQLPAATAQVLSQARPERLVVLGDDLAVSDQVARAAASYTTTGTWTRLAGQNRYETAALVAGQFEPGVAEVAIATGEDFADALAAVPVAAAHRSPVLLAPPTGLPQPVADVLRQLSPQRVLIVGGEASLPPAVAQAAGRAAGAPVSRVAGVDRYDTAAKLALRLPAPTPVAYIATGHAFPDAVTGAVLAAAERGPLLLTTPTRLAPASARTLAALRPARIYVLGGATAVSGRVAVGLSALTR
jgi:putative cell wall-binding protein